MPQTCCTCFRSLQMLYHVVDSCYMHAAAVLCYCLAASLTFTVKLWRNEAQHFSGHKKPSQCFCDPVLQIRWKHATQAFSPFFTKVSRPVLKFTFCWSSRFIIKAFVFTFRRQGLRDQRLGWDPYFKKHGTIWSVPYDIVLFDTIDIDIWLVWHLRCSSFLLYIEVWNRRRWPHLHCICHTTQSAMPSVETGWWWLISQYHAGVIWRRSYERVHLVGRFQMVQRTEQSEQVAVLFVSNSLRTAVVRSECWGGQWQGSI